MPCTQHSPTLTHIFLAILKVQHRLRNRHHGFQQSCLGEIFSLVACLLLCRFSAVVSLSSLLVWILMTAHWKSRLCTIGASALRCDVTEKETDQLLIKDNTGGVQCQRSSVGFLSLSTWMSRLVQPLPITRVMGHWLHLHFSSASL